MYLCCLKLTTFEIAQLSSASDISIIFQQNAALAQNIYDGLSQNAIIRDFKIQNLKYENEMAFSQHI